MIPYELKICRYKHCNFVEIKFPFIVHILLLRKLYITLFVKKELFTSEYLTLVTGNRCDKCVETCNFFSVAIGKIFKDRNRTYE